MLLTEKTRSILESAQKKMVVLFRLKIVKPLPPKKHFYRSFGLMQGAGRRGKSKPFSVLVLDRILLFLIFDFCRQDG